MAVGEEFSLVFEMTAEYVNEDLQLRNEYADLDLCKGTGPQRETWELSDSLCN